MFCHAGPSSLAFLVGCKILTDSDFQIQISKNGLQFKLKLHQVGWTFLRPVGKYGLDSGLDWTGLGGNFFLGGEVVLLF